MTALESLEHYSSAHPESIEVLMEWPYRRFLRAYDAFQRRSLCDEYRARKREHVAALHANSAFEKVAEGGEARKSAIESIEDSYERMISAIWNKTLGKEDEEEKGAWNSPMMRAGRRAVAASFSRPVMPGQRQIEALPQR